MLLLAWGAVTSLIVLLSFLLYGFYSPTEAASISAERMLFAYVILAAVLGGAIFASVHIAGKAK